MPPILVLSAVPVLVDAVDTTGRVIRDDKRGRIDENLPPILERLSLSQEQWFEHVTQFEVNYQKYFAKKRRPRNKILANTG